MKQKLIMMAIVVVIVVGLRILPVRAILGQYRVYRSVYFWCDSGLAGKGLVR